MTQHFNNLSPAQAERLALLMEECAEVQQVVGKILRHGLLSHHPDGGPTNRALLERELGDLMCAVDMMVAAGEIERHVIEEYCENKRERVKQYLHHQDEA